jgi:glycosyltransferase involved in cell wall biosynthesis
MSLSVVVPCFNEERGLTLLHEALVAVLPAVAGEYEVVLVDDGSTDRTLREMRGLASADPHVRYVSLSRNFGKEAAILAGLHRARGQRVVLMDADLQHPPWLLPRMLRVLDSGYDQVVARRSRDGEGLVRTALSRLFYWGINKFSDVRLIDGAGDFRALSRRAVDAVLSMRENTRFSKGMFSWIGFDTALVSYRNVVRERGKTKWTTRALLDHGIDGLISFNTAPLRLSVYFGAVVTAVAFVYSAAVVVNVVLGGVHVPGYATLMVGVLGLGGLQMLFLGMIGEYLSRIYTEVKGRPHFLVRESTAPLWGGATGAFSSHALSRESA